MDEDDRAYMTKMRYLEGRYLFVTCRINLVIVITSPVRLLLLLLWGQRILLLNLQVLFQMAAFNFSSEVILLGLFGQEGS